MKLKDRFIRFMYGRYGVDSFGKFTIWGSLILMLIAAGTAAIIGGACTLVGSQDGRIGESFPGWHGPVSSILISGCFPKILTNEPPRIRNICR